MEAVTGYSYIDTSVFGAVRFQDAYYYYTTNAQGDVTAILDSSGKKIGTYTYDAWGKPITTTAHHALTIVNPLRYRGYVYDQETELYYLQSRYYNPEVGRFLNADNYPSTGQGLTGNNMFAYCMNNPVMNMDPDGNITISALILIGSAILGAVTTAVTAYTEYQAGVDTFYIVGDSICAGMAAFMLFYSGGMTLYQCYLNYCYLNALTPVTQIGSPPTNNTVDLYRAVCNEEYSAAKKSQTVSSDGRNYAEGKYYATTQADATTWGSKMYRNEPYAVMQVTLDQAVLDHPSTMYWERLDSIGPAYYLANDNVNAFMICIK